MQRRGGSKRRFHNSERNAIGGKIARASMPHDDQIMSDNDLWSLSYHLCGCTLLGATSQEPLGTLPLSVRIAVLDIASRQASARFPCTFNPPTQLNYEAGQHATYRYWQTDPRDLLERLAKLDVEQTPDFASPDAYFQHYQLWPTNESEANDEHWAERQFVQRIFVPLCGLKGLRYLKPQVSFTDSRRVERRIDFALEGEKRYALEIEGKTYHDGVERFDREKARQRELTQAGFHYFPLSWKDVEGGQAESALHGLIKRDALLRSLLEPTEGLDLLPLAWLLSVLPQRYPDAQRTALAALAHAAERGLSRLTVMEIGGGMPILTLALIDTLGLVERVADFYGLPVTLPELDVYLITPRNRDLQEQLLHQVLQSDRDPHERLDTPRTAVHLTVADALPADFPENTLVVAESPCHSSNARTFAELANWGQRFADRWPRPPDRPPASTGLERPTLDYFARRYFQVPELKAEQIELLQRALRGQDSIGILPTGFGKSLVFQLYALLSPRVTLVISPLKALIQDQVGALRRLGWACVDFVLSIDTAEQRQRRLDDMFHSQRYRLFYIAPERLQLKAFYDELRASLHDTSLGALVIDEAHCVSEWGHDFRPAYLQIPRLRRLLEESTHRRVPLLALTATASPLVRADILDTLQLVPDDLIQSTSCDRRNLRLSVHPVPAEAGAKSKALARLLTDDLPRVLGQPYGFDFQEVNGDRYPEAGIVFAMYADPHGKTTFAEGTAHIAAELRKTMGLSKDQVRTHASRVPKVCPRCGSHDYWQATPQEAAQANFGDKALTCHNCRQVFIQPRRVANRDWETTLQQRHEDFKQDRFPLLVATKGFGMGIDKRNVSFVVHHAFASGLEGYYQEAGRAGRANQRAHVALLYIPPTDTCIRDTIDQGEMPRCMTDPDSFKYRKCPRPYNLKVLCDFSHQARFIQDSYPGVKVDCKTTYDVYKRLKAGQPLASSDDYTPPGQHGDDDANDVPDPDRKRTVYQLALYRLQQLGIVLDYTIQYFSLKAWQFEVEFEAHWQPQALLTHVERFLRRGQHPETDDITEPMRVLSDLAAQCAAPPWLEEHLCPEIALLKKAIGTLLRRVYLRVPAMRLQMLRNELDYARAAEGTCRRVTLLNLFNNRLVVSDYRCGFCDVCLPDLGFTQTLATDAVGNIDLDELVLQLNDLLATAQPEPVALYNFIDHIQERGVALGMLARATRHLEGDPTSLPALYLVGALSWQVPTRQNQALGYLRAGFKEGRQQGLTLDALLELFYRAGAEIDAEDAVRWLNDLAPRTTDPGALLRWAQTLEPLLGSDSPAYRALYAIAKARALQRLSGPFQELKTLASGWPIPPTGTPHQHPAPSLPLKKRSSR